MKKQLLSGICLLFILAVKGQYTLQLSIHSLPANHPAGAAIYLAGTFNNWNPHDEKFKLDKNKNGSYSVSIPVNNKTGEYKLTRGGWDKVECDINGKDISNRQYDTEVNELIGLTVEGWKDKFSPKPRTSTASKNVKIIDTAFHIPQLNRVRRVWIYLPENYYTGSAEHRWPVLYMHDGQNVFDDGTSFSGEWGVDEFLDTAFLKSCIVVAIDNGANKRVNEYCPYDFSLKTLGISNADTLSKGEGVQYVDFLVKILKPFIDKNYRTLKGKENTFIAGSSMGGLISMYAVLKYPKVFGGAGVFSPAFWVAPRIFDEIRSKGKKTKAKIYFYAGKQEGETMVPLTLKAFEAMSKISKSEMTTVIRDDGKHNESRWRMEFPAFYIWMMHKNPPVQLNR